MTPRPRRVRKPCPICSRRVRITRKARRFREHTVDWRPGAPRCSASGTPYAAPVAEEARP